MVSALESEGFLLIADFKRTWSKVGQGHDNRKFWQSWEALHLGHLLWETKERTQARGRTL